MLEVGARGGCAAPLPPGPIGPEGRSERAAPRGLRASARSAWTLSARNHGALRARLELHVA